MDEKEKTFWDIDIRSGTVEFDDISLLPDDFKVDDHIDFLKEDMLQITYPGGAIIDVGWRPSFDRNGCFRCVLIRDGDWDHPLSDIEACDVVATKQALAWLVKDASR
ncbi:hypothetical protein [Massilia sp. METH4]|uniref:hypothetical protein n=1 Tax=Massilia sp. METH4 TaxID=3123041 RepID=UPI0030D36EE7